MEVVVSYICNKLKQGRPKNVYALVDCGTAQLQEKRAQFGLQSNSDPMTCLYMLWSRKKIDNNQFLAGCYYEEISYKLKRSTGTLQGGYNSSLARLQDSINNGFFNDVNKIKTLKLNEKCADIVHEMQKLASYVHIKGIRLLDEIIMQNDLESYKKLDTMFNQDLQILQKVLDVLYHNIIHKALNQIQIDSYHKEYAIK